MKNKDTGILVIYTGNGKGKTSAALGMCIRAIGHDWSVCLIQFIKGSWKCGELEGLKRLEPNVELHVIGEGFVGILDDKKEFVEHQRSAEAGLILAGEKISSGKYDLVILDELNVALDLKLISRDQVQKLLTGVPESQNLVLTGRGAPGWLIEQADLVTDMVEVKHPFQKGIPAKKGIDW